MSPEAAGTLLGVSFLLWIVGIFLLILIGSDDQERPLLTILGLFVVMGAIGSCLAATGG